MYLNPIDTSIAARRALDDHFAAFAPAAAARTTASATEQLPARDTTSDEDAQPDFLRLADLARLRRLLRAGDLDLLAAINKSRNNTSVVTRWRGRA